MAKKNQSPWNNCNKRLYPESIWNYTVYPIVDENIEIALETRTLELNFNIIFEEKDIKRCQLLSWTKPLNMSLRPLKLVRRDWPPS